MRTNLKVYLFSAIYTQIKKVHLFPTIYTQIKNYIYFHIIYAHKFKSIFGGQIYRVA